MSRNLETTRARRAPCHRCGAPVLSGIAEGYPTTVDAEPIPPESEYLALLDGRYTATLNLRGELWDRPAWRIRSQPGPNDTIHAQHRCAEKCEPAEQLPLPLEGIR